MMHPAIVEAARLVCSRDVRDYRRAAAICAQLAACTLSELEARHLAAVERAAHGDYPGAARIYDEIIEDDPSDLFALETAHVFDYFLGNPQALRARSERAYRASPAHPAVLALHAFALEECGDYEQAEALARRALDIDPYEVRAHHAVAHVLEMRGRFEEGIRWMGSRSAFWTGAGAASTHQWWHLALYHLELGNGTLALAIYDRRIQGGVLSELIDASALLWRAQLAGCDIGSRFEPLAARWAPYAEDAHCAFNDVHAMMAFAGAGREDLARRLLAAQERRIASNQAGANLDMTRLVGLPACRALLAFSQGDFTSAERLLRALPPVAHRIGGSHAQRDVLHLTRFSAAARKRSGFRRAA